MMLDVSDRINGMSRRLCFKGWANQMTHCVFIGRRWETDKLILTKGIEYFHDVDYNAQVYNHKWHAMVTQ